MLPTCTSAPSPPPPAGDVRRVYRPQRDGEDTFLPAAPYDAEAAAVPGLPPLDPAAVAAAAAAAEAAAAGRGGGGGASRGEGGPLASAARWGDLPLLDRKPLEDRLVAELATHVRVWGRRGRGFEARRWAAHQLEALEGRTGAPSGRSGASLKVSCSRGSPAPPAPLPQAAPKFRRRQGAHWSPPDDGWAFDLSVRPPTPGLDLLTDYLEVKYRWGGRGGWRGGRKLGVCRPGQAPPASALGSVNVCLALSTAAGSTLNAPSLLTLQGPAAQAGCGGGVRAPRARGRARGVGRRGRRAPARRARRAVATRARGARRRDGSARRRARGGRRPAVPGAC
jgi:hypothetical protein